eukprot:227391_1
MMPIDAQNIPPNIDNNTITFSLPSSRRRNMLMRKVDKRTEWKTTLDHIFNETTDQNEIFKTAGQPLMEQALNGFNTSILAYGQTSTGKTHSMFGVNKIDYFVYAYVRYTNIPIPVDLIKIIIIYTNLKFFSFEFFMYQDFDSMGLVPRSIIYLFQQLQKQRNQQIINTFSVSMQIVQIHNKSLMDILNPNSTNDS